MYYPCSENKGADQLRGYREADLRLCFRICKKPVFSGRGSFDDNKEIMANGLAKAILMRTNNIGFYEDLTKIIFQLSSNIIKYAPYLFFCYHLDKFMRQLKLLLLRVSIFFAGILPARDLLLRKSMLRYVRYH